MGFDWAVIHDNLPFLMRGLWNSVQLAAITVVLSFPLGCIVALGRISRRRWLRNEYVTLS